MVNKLTCFDLNPSLPSYNHVLKLCKVILLINQQKINLKLFTPTIKDLFAINFFKNRTCF